jgi:hypothetical protein
MSAVAQAYLQTQTAIEHAKSLFTHDPAPPTGAIKGAATLATAHEAAASALTKTTALSGAGVSGYREFAVNAAPLLEAAAKNDFQLGALLQQAAAISRAGSAQLESLYQQLLAARPRVAAATSAAAQRAAVAELSAYVRSADHVVKTSGQAASGLAAQVRAVRYSGAAVDDFDVDTQYVRPAGFTGGTPPPDGTVEITIAATGPITAVTAMTQTKTWWTQPGGSKGKHCA